MTRIPFETIELPPEANPLGPIAQAAGAAIGAACGFYRENPAAAVGREYDAPGVAALDALYRRMCDRRPEGPLPPVNLPFNGGQCTTNYRVRVVYSIPGTPLSGDITRVLPGPIRGISSQAAGVGLTAWGILFRDGFSTYVAVGSDQEFQHTVSVQRVDGGADNCGDPSPVLAGPYRGTNLPTLTRPPVLLPRGPGLPSIPIPPIIIPTIPVTIVPTFSPEINVNLGPFNFNFNFGGGAPYTPSPPTGLPPSSPPVLPPPSSSPPSLPPGAGSNCPPCNAGEVDLEPVLDKLDESLEKQKFYRDTLLECLGTNGNLTFQVLGSGVTGQVALPNDAVAVLITATGPMPETPVKKIRNPGNQADVFFGGWTQVILGDGFALPRDPISGDKCSYWLPRPQGSPVAMRFSWTSVLNVEYSVGVIRVAKPLLPLSERPCQL